MSKASQSVTRGIRVTAEPEYNEQHSKPEASLYVYSYHITIYNEGKDVVQLLSRHWNIQDGFGHIEQVVGQGVIGQQPVLKPGEQFSYSSFCPLKTPTGTMQGTYQMRGSDQAMFDVMIAPFELKSKNVLN
jgi:ApaG protein